MSHHPAHHRPPRRRLLLALLALASSLAGRGATADSPWEAPPFSLPPAALLAAAEAVERPATGEVQVLLYEITYRLDEGGVATRREHLVYQILTPSALPSWGAAEAVWRPGLEATPTLRARLVRPDGTTRRPPDERIEERLSRPLRKGGEAHAVVALPGADAGSVVETEVTVEQRRHPSLAGGMVRREWLAMTVPVHRARLVLDVPAGLPLAVDSHGVEALPGGEAAAGRRLLRFEALDSAPVEILDPGLPPELPVAPFAAFATGGSWGAVARAYSERLDAVLAAGSPPSLVPDGPVPASQWERMEELLAALHRRVRSSGPGLGSGGAGPPALGPVVERGAGDGEAKAALLVALLRDAGIPAYVALIDAGLGPDVPRELPGLGLFDRALVFVPGGTPVWVDPGDPHVPLGMLPPVAQGRFALVAAPNTRGLIRTPTATSDDNRIVEAREIHLAGRGPARVVEESELWGNPAREIRASWAGAGEEAIRRLLADYVETTYGATTLVRHGASGLENPAAPLTLRLEASGAACGVTEGDEATVLLPLDGLFQRLPPAFLRAPDTTGPRRHDYVLPEPHRIEWHLTVHLPPGFRIDELPSPATEPWGGAVFRRRVETAADGRSVVVRLLFDTGRRRFTPAEVEAVRRGLAALDEDGELILLLRFPRITP